MFKRYYKITKPGIITGNTIAALGGFLLAAKGDIDWNLMLATIMGLALIVASGCTINNCIDRDIDAVMKRTQHRVTVTGEISLKAAFAHGVVLGILGFVLLLIYTNAVTVFFAVFGYCIYVGVYSLYMKRHSVYGTFVGSLSGAVPPVVGYCAVSGQFDMAAAILLLMFCLWQMPHSYAIAIFRYQDYRAANIPVLPVARGIETAKHRIVFYIAVFSCVSALLPLTGRVGFGYLAIALATSAWWLVMALRGYRQNTDVVRWSKQVFAFSILQITVLSLMMALDYTG